MKESNPQPEDPFFFLPESSEWNACIGQQGAEENYVDGYIEAAIELASAVINKKLYGKRDTLVLPILYNARHALELCLKFSISELYNTKAIGEKHPKNHDIMSHWSFLSRSNIGDEEIRNCVRALEPYVASLFQIDEDGQELRYFENTSGQKSLADKTLANIVVILSSIEKMRSIIDRLKYRIFDYTGERLTGTYTAECSRRDLIEIASLLPIRGEWGGPGFDEAKFRISERFCLSSRKFSKAIKLIQTNRQMKGLIGLSTDLLYLKDKSAVFAVEQWATRHPLPPTAFSFDYYNFEQLWKTMEVDWRLSRNAHEKISNTLSPEEIADLNAIYYIGQSRIFCEYYEKHVEAARNNQRTKGGTLVMIQHLMSKTNFQECVVDGISLLGRPDLADRLRQVQRIQQAKPTDAP